MDRSVRPARPGERLAVFPGSFDPMTLGHVDVAARAVTMFDRVVIAVARNAAKVGRYLFDDDERLALARSSVSHLEGVEVGLVTGLLAQYCQQIGASAIIKGLRSGTDLDAELPMALVNRDLGGPETVFLVAAPTRGHVSSSLVKDVARHGGDVSNLVAPEVASALAARYALLSDPDSGRTAAGRATEEGEGCDHR